ncbi:MAG: DUF11 domain-containing protein [Anaerolineales bacterium]|nr:DUF11 domain-containing protein [Anaerolineales bacterium]
MYAGQTVTYTIAATNNGDSPLANVVVEESIPECTLTPISLGDGDAILGPGERWTYSCSLTVSADVANTANASGVDLKGKTWTDTATETVQVVRPHIRIRKSVDKPYIYPGETANFTMIVKNIGNDPLRNVVVTDSMPQCKLSAPVGDNGDGILSPDEEWTYSCAVVF